MSDPCPPAFIRTAPPDRARHADGPRQTRPPGSATCRARTGRASAPPARTHERRVGPHDPSGPHHGRGEGSSSPANPRPRRITTPSKPASATSRFEPRPMTNSGSPRIARDLAQHAADALEVGRPSTSTKSGGRSAHAVGGERPSGALQRAPGRRVRRPGAPVRGDRGVTTAATPAARRAASSGRPRPGQAEVAGAQHRTPPSGAARPIPGRRPRAAAGPGPHGVGDEPARHPGDRALAGAVDVGDDQGVGIGERGAELVGQRRRPRVAVRLEDRDDAGPAPGPGRRQGGPTSPGRWA